MAKISYGFSLEHFQNWCRLLTVDPPMGAVRPASLFLGLVHLDVGYEEGVHIQAFHLDHRRMR